MIAIPIQVSDTHYDIVLVFDDKTIDRIKEYNPAEFKPANMAMPMFEKLNINNISFAYATEAEIKRIIEFQMARDLRSILKLLSRGWKYRPELGDHDGPYQRPNVN